MNWTAVGIVGTLLLSLIGSLFGLYQARRADHSATTTRTIELGVKDLIDQYQEANSQLHTEVSECKGECATLRQENGQLKTDMADLERRYDNLEAEVIRLKQKAGELK